MDRKFFRKVVVNGRLREARKSGGRGPLGIMSLLRPHFG